MVANDRNWVLNLTWCQRWIRHFCDFRGSASPIRFNSNSALLRNPADHQTTYSGVARTICPYTPVSGGCCRRSISLLDTNRWTIIECRYRRAYVRESCIFFHTLRVSRITHAVFFFFFLKAVFVAKLPPRKKFRRELLQTRAAKEQNDV